MKYKVEQEPSCECFITNSGLVVEKEILKEFGAETPASQQITNETWGEDIVTPPYNLGKLLAWQEKSVVHSSCIRTKTQDAVGIGWFLEADEDAEQQSKVEEDKDYDILNAFFKKANPNEDFTMMIKKVFQDYEANGNGYIEVTRDIDDKVNGLFHVNSGEVRWGKDKKKLCQMIGQNKVWFKLFGEEKILDKSTGVFSETSTNPANEIIPITQYTWMSSLYGLPSWLPAIWNMFGDVKETEYNIDFFLNFGIPAYAVIVEGQGSMNQELKDEITKYFETTLKGTGSQHKTLILNTPAGITIRFDKLSNDEKESSFRGYHKDNTQAILTAHGVPPYRVGIVEQGQLGGDVAEDMDRIYLDSTINPKQELFAWIIREKIIKEGFEIDSWKLRFKDININDEERESKIEETYIKNGIKSPNEIRKEKGLDPYENGDILYVASGLTPIGVTKDSTDVIETEMTDDEVVAGKEEMGDEE